MPPVNELLQTKLTIPPTSHDHVPRPRLIDRLNEGAGCALTLVSAPAGSGKTTLLSAWARQCDGSVAWVSLDRRDNDPARFASYLVAALRAPGLELPDPAMPDPDSFEKVLESTLAAAVNRLAERQTPLALALDDYHLIDHPAIHAALAFFLDHLPAGARVILSTRVDPPFPLARLRGSGGLAEARFDSLRFSLEETAAYLETRLDGQLGPQEVEALQERTEGWIAGLQMAALSLHGSPDPRGLVESFAGTHHHVLDYLVDEVLDRQPQHVQDFLLETSILEQLSGPLCSAVTRQPDGRARLEALERDNLFMIPLDHNRRWYRYHHLFAGALRERLARRSPHALRELHRRACAWYAENDSPAEAIDHALAAGDPHHASALIERFAERFWMRSQVVSLLRWIQAIQLDVRRTHPRLCLWEAWMLLLTGDWQRVSPILETVEARLEDSEDGGDGTGELRGMLGAMRAFQANISGHPEAAIPHANQALEAISEQNLNWRGAVAHILGDSYRLQGDVPAAGKAYAQAEADSRRARNVFGSLVALRYQGEMQFESGHLLQAEDTFQKALRYARRHGAEGWSATGTVHISLGSLYYQRGELDRARRHLEAGLAVCEATGHGIGLVLSHCALARLHHAAGENGEARRHLERADQHAENHALQQLYWYPQTLRALFDLDQAMHDGWDQSRLQLVEQWAVRSGLKDEDRPRAPGLRHLVYSRLLVLQGMAKGTYQPALDYLDAIIEATASEIKTEHEIGGWLLRARALRGRGDEEAAIQTLARALEVGVERGFVQVFLDEGQDISNLIQEFLIHLPEHPAAGLAAHVLAHSRKRDGERERSLETLFSPREVEVLRLMASGRTNRQIADELVIAESTVKTHLRHVYRKLKVGNRTEAVHRLQSMDMLPAS